MKIIDFFLQLLKTPFFVTTNVLLLVSPYWKILVIISPQIMVRSHQKINTNDCLKSNSNIRNEFSTFKNVYMCVCSFESSQHVGVLTCPIKHHMYNHDLLRKSLIYS